MNHWSICHSDSNKDDKADNLVVKLITILRYKNKEMARGTGMMQRDSLTKLCREYNESGNEPKKTPVCIADLPPSERPAAIKKMSDGIQWGFKDLILDPFESASARRKYKGG